MTSPSVGSKRIRKFFGSRMPISDSVLLEQRSTYILPTKAGLLLLAVILLMMIGATNYQNNLAFMLTFLTASIGLVSILFTFKNLQGLQFKMGRSESVCAGEKVHVVVLVESQNNQSHSAIALGTSKLDLCYINVDPKSNNQVEIAIPTKTRGWFKIPRLMATSRFPFGLLNAWAWFQFTSPILIYPKPVAPPAVTGSQHHSDELESQPQLGSDDLYGLKLYQQGEPISRIDWKALAREKGLFSKQFVDHQSQEAVFSWNDFSGYPTESILSFLCYLVNQASNDNIDFALEMPNQSIPLNSGRAHLTHCLSALACYGLDKE